MALRCVCTGGPSTKVLMHCQYVLVQHKTLQNTQQTYDESYRNPSLAVSTLLWRQRPKTQAIHLRVAPQMVPCSMLKHKNMFENIRLQTLQQRHPTKHNHVCANLFTVETAKLWGPYGKHVLKSRHPRQLTPKTIQEPRTHPHEYNILLHMIPNHKIFRRPKQKHVTKQRWRSSRQQLRLSLLEGVTAAQSQPQRAGARTRRASGAQHPR